MGKVAIFMGAGVSKAFGFPLTNELLPRIRREVNKGTIFGRGPKAKADAEALAEYLGMLLPGFNLPDITLPLITDVLSLIDLSLTSSNIPLPRAATPEMLRFRVLLERAIFEVLDWPYGDHDVPQSLTRFTDWLFHLSHCSGAGSVGLISTNYDIAVEAELFDRFEEETIRDKFDFGFSWRDPFKEALYKRPHNPSFHLYKLHGSLNWLRCDLCEHIYINVRGVIAHRAFDQRVTNQNSCHCGHGRLRAVLVAPSLVRDVRDGNLLEIWKNALEFLRVAPEWVLIGYSFPPEDITIRSLFIRAYRGRRTPPRIRVIQKGHDETTRSRYKLFFPDCIYQTDGLEEFLPPSPHESEQPVKGTAGRHGRAPAC
jgi:hypothetical protein